LEPKIEVLFTNNRAQYNEKKYKFRRPKKRSAWERDEEVKLAEEEEKLFFMKDEVSSLL
jgi:hypothetical protein